MKCARCGFENDADAEFCENCGTALARICTNCGSPLKLESRFCKKCGTAVSSPSTATRDEIVDAEGRERLAALQHSAPAALRDKIRASSTKIEGERKAVTILFADIVGSTALAEKLDPEEWKEIVSGAHQRVSEAVYRYEGTIAQLLGDGVLAFFGAPVTHEDDPLRAVRAALDLQRSVEGYAGQLRGYTDSFQMRAGINTGTVVVGQVGGELHMEYLAIGDAVNLAARLQSAAQPGKVLISESTARLVMAAFELEALGEIAVKGKVQPVKVFEVIVRKAAPASGRGLEGLRSPLVGRDRELAVLEAALAELAAGRGQIVSLLGKAGIGKTRLMDDGRRAQAHLKWLQGRAPSYGQALPFWTIRQLIQSDLGLSEGDPEARIKVALRRRVKTLFGEQADESLPYLLLVFGIGLEAEAAGRLRALDEATVKRQIHAALSSYFARLAAEQPTVLVFEDLHWADPSTLQVLESLLALTDRVPLLLLLLARVERDQGWWVVKQRAETDYAHRYTNISLKPLTAGEQNQLVDNLLEAAELPEATRRLMLERSEGNPFYLEEVIRSLIEQGALVHHDQGWRATDRIAAVQIPDTLQGVLLARIDRLSDDVRHTLQAASVIGKSFLYELLEAVVEADRQLDAHLSELQRVDLVQEKARRPELEYIFKHSLTQAAAYDSLLLDRRKEFHRRVGLALERLYANRREDAYGLMAYHFGRAGEPEKSLEYANKAGDRARGLFAYPEAIDYYQQVLDVLKAQKEYELAARTAMKVGLLHHILFDFTRSHAAYEDGFALWQASENTPLPASPPAPHALRVHRYSPQTIDPGLTADSNSDAFVDQLFDGLIALTPDLDVVPAVARTWDVLDGGQKYVFHLHDGARWSDGVALTAHDFEFAWKRVLSPQLGSAVAPRLYVIKGARAYHQGQVPTSQAVGVRALDDLTLEVELESPTGYFLHLLTQSYACPVPRHVVEKLGPAWTEVGHLVCNGRFQLGDWRLRQSMTLSRNSSYHGRFRGNVQLIEIVLQNDLDADVSLELYEADRLDIIRVPPAKINAMRQRYPAEYLSGPLAGTTCLMFDQTRPPFDDIRVRRAFAHGIDRDALANQILSGMVVPALGGSVPPGIVGHSAAIGPAYDPERARQLLAEAGFPNGRDFPEVELLVSRNPLRISTMAYLQTLLQANLGVAIHPSTADTFPEFLERVGSKDPPAMYISGWLADYPDANIFLTQFELSRSHNAVFDQLLEEASHVSDQVERTRLHQAADRIVMDEALAIPLYYDRYHLLVKPWISHLRLSPVETLNWQDIVIEPH